MDSNARFLDFCLKVDALAFAFTLGVIVGYILFGG